jgi:DeoR family fructose operon transcriptional repressor
MSLQSRKQQIVRLIEAQGEMSVADLAAQTGSSEPTIRRDLWALAQEGLLYRTHGGAMKLSLVQRPVGFAQKISQNLDKKDYICQLAAREVSEGDTIFMDCGSTVFRLCHYLKNKRIRVITNSLPVVAEFLQSEVSVNLIGGEVDKERQAVHGLVAGEHIRRYRADKAFLGVDGISLANGLSAHSEKEAELSLQMMQQARQNYLLCDATKLERDAQLSFAEISRIHVLVTDAPDSLIEPYRLIISKILN